MTLEFYHAGNHNEEFGTHLNYEDYKIRTPRITTNTGSFVKLIDRDLYHDTYLTTVPAKTLRAPVVKKFITSFLLYSESSDSGLYSAIVTIRVNIYPDNERVTIDINPLTNSQSGLDSKSPVYNDLLTAFLEDMGSGKYNLKVYLKYVLPYSDYRIKVLHTSLNDGGYYNAYVDLYTHEYGLYKYPETEYRQNMWLFIKQDDLAVITESALPIANATISQYKANNILANLLNVKTSLFEPTSASVIQRRTLYVDASDELLRFRSQDGKNLPIRIMESGTTAERPTTGLVVGRDYFDITLGKPIYYKGSNIWVDSTGATV